MTAIIQLKQTVSVYVIDEEHPGVVEFLKDASLRNSFAASLYNQLCDKGTLSPRQTDCAVRMFNESKERDVARAERVATAPEMDMSKIYAMFDVARKNGLKRLAYRAKGFIITPASDHSHNAGALYLKKGDGTYLGKISSGKFIKSAMGSTADMAALALIAADPSAEARKYGIETGQCCICGRELTDPESIKLGIGPICATKWEL